MDFHVSIEDEEGVSGTDVSADDMDSALMEAMNFLGLEGRDEGSVTIRIQRS